MNVNRERYGKWLMSNEFLKMFSVEEVFKMIFIESCILDYENKQLYFGNIKVQKCVPSIKENWIRC